MRESSKIFDLQGQSSRYPWTDTPENSKRAILRDITIKYVFWTVRDNPPSLGCQLQPITSRATVSKQELCWSGIARSGPLHGGFIRCKKSAHNVDSRAFSKQKGRASQHRCLLNQ